MVGVVRASGGDFDVAIQLFSKVLELDPNHEAARKHIHEARLQQMNERQRAETAANHSTAGNGQSRQHSHQHTPVQTTKTAHKRAS